MAPRGLRRSGLVAGGLVLLGGGAVGAYFMLAATPRKPAVDANVTAVEGAAVPNGPAVPTATAVPTAPARKPPARYRLDVTVSLGSAHLDLDGQTVGTGSIDRELARDGAEHTLVIAAPGFQPARFTFRDRPPPQDVTLEPIAAGARKADPSPVATTGRPKSSPHEHERPHAHGSGHPEPATSPVGGTHHGSPQNGAPILD
jgi:hypothetical protein